MSMSMSTSIVDLYSAESYKTSLLHWVCWLAVENRLQQLSEAAAAAERQVRSVDPATEKARRPKGVGTVRWCRLAERRWSRVAMSEAAAQQFTKYLAALLCRHRCTVTPILYSMRRGTSNQCKSSCSNRPITNLCVRCCSVQQTLWFVGHGSRWSGENGTTVIHAWLERLTGIHD